MPQASSGSKPGLVGVGDEPGQPVGAAVGEVAADHHQLDPGGVGLDDVLVGVLVAALEDDEVGGAARARARPSLSLEPGDRAPRRG